MDKSRSFDVLREHCADADCRADELWSVQLHYSRFRSSFHGGTPIASDCGPPRRRDLGLGDTTIRTRALAFHPVTAGANATFVSQNAGNPVGTYSWSFNGGAPLTDGPHYTGTSSSALTISNVQQGDVGTYTVTGVNNDPLTNSISYTNSASALLSIGAPTLHVSYVSRPTWLFRGPPLLVATRWHRFAHVVTGELADGRATSDCRRQLHRHCERAIREPIFPAETIDDRRRMSPFG